MLAALHAGCGIYHWGDRDIGGLRIFTRLGEAYSCHRLQPHLMDEPIPEGSDFSDTDRQWLLRYQKVQGGSAELASRWLDAGLGPMEQEAVDPRGPAD